MVDPFAGVATAEAPRSADPTDREPGAVAQAFGPMTGLRIIALVLAIGFLTAAVGYAVGNRHGTADPLSATDVGFMQDMGYHHDQAVQMSIILLGKPDVDPDLGSYAMEIIMGQRMEEGVFNATLDRYGHASSPGRTAMGWMGPHAAVPVDQMEGLATAAQMAELTSAKGRTAAALWIALMSEHHLGGIHMADYEARHGHDRTTTNLALAMVRTQRGEILDLQRYRTMHQLPIPKGFTDPAKDQRLIPLSLSLPAPD
ncbi:MAG: hypothetical protein JWM89_538 [Acidimicrobiales bacterium]|nr:hypothetical protein [Acidimicrobiales bacterium]